MYKEIEDVLKDAMNMQSTPQPKCGQENIGDDEDSSNTDPLQGIEEGLELVNSILKNTLEENFDNSPGNTSGKSDLAKYLNFQSHSNMLQSSGSHLEVQAEENFKTTNEDTKPMKPSSGMNIEKEIDNNLKDFLIENQNNVLEESSDQLMSSPVIK